MTERWCIPPEQDAAFVAAMEDVLDVDHRPPDPARPLVCFDEGGKELRAERRPGTAPAPGQPAREDAEYVRQGSGNLLLCCAPHLGWRHVDVTTQRTAIDWAEMMQALVDVHFPEAAAIVLVLDNLNTQTPASLYKRFAPAEAKRIWDKLEIHYTPKHGSWLNIAECELSALARQCLDRRLPDQDTLATEVSAWADARNAAQARVHWQFTTAAARITLARLYPVLEPGKE